MLEGGMLMDFPQYIVYSLLVLEQGRLSRAFEFLINATISTFPLLSLIIFIVSIIRSNVPPERTKQVLSDKNEFMERPYGVIADKLKHHRTSAINNLLVQGGSYA